MTKKSAERALLIGAVFFANVVEFVRLPIWGGSRTVFISLLLVSLAMRSWRTLPCTLVLALMSLQGLVLPRSLDGAPVIGFLGPFLIAALVLIAFPGTRSALQWVRKGSIDRISGGLIALTSVVSALALVLWAYWTDHLGIGEEFVKAFGPASAFMIYVVYVPLFALLNAWAEEAVYRGLMQESLTRVFASPLWICGLQATAFAAVHYASGFPNGVVGYLMVLVYGGMLGYLRLRTKGILAPYLAHVVADVTIALLLIRLAR